MTEAGDLIATVEAAELRGVSTRTIHRWADSGLLPIAVRMPGKTGALLFERADVLAVDPKHAHTGEIAVISQA